MDKQVFYSLKHTFIKTVFTLILFLTLLSTRLIDLQNIETTTTRQDIQRRYRPTLLGPTVLFRYICSFICLIFRI
jgi:hypothetical protein